MLFLPLKSIHINLYLYTISLIKPPKTLLFLKNHLKEYTLHLILYFVMHWIIIIFFFSLTNRINTTQITQPQLPITKPDQNISNYPTILPLATQRRHNLSMQSPAPLHVCNPATMANNLQPTPNILSSKYLKDKTIFILKSK